MFTIKRIPNYLPLGYVLDNSQIGFVPKYIDGRFFSEDTIHVGGEIELYREFNKYIITTYHSDNIVKEYAFICKDQFHNSTMYPIFIKTYNLNNPLEFTTPPILLKRGIVNVRNDIFDDKIIKSVRGLDFTINKYLNLITDQLYNSDVLKGIMSYIQQELYAKYKFYASDVLYHTSVENMGYDAAVAVEQIDDMLDGHTAEMPAGESGVIHNLLDSFGPDIDFRIDQDPFSVLCYRNGGIDKFDLSWYLKFGNPKIDTIAEEDTLINHYISISDEIVYSDPDTLKAAKYLLSMIKECPYTDMYLKFSVYGSTRNFVLQEPLSVSNKFYNIYTTKISNNYLERIQLALEGFFYDLFIERPYMKINQLEVILRDYHVLLVLETEELRILYIFDLVLLSSITEAIMYSNYNFEEPYLEKENEIWQW